MDVCDSVELFELRTIIFATRMEHHLDHDINVLYTGHSGILN